MTTEDNPSKRTRPGKLRVLVADDVRDQADSLAFLVTAWGHDVRVVYDGLTALQVADSYQPDVAVLDLGLPGMDGYQVAVHLRRQPALKDIKLIALTGYDWQGAELRSKEYGFGQHCLEPVKPDDLKHLLASVKPLARG